MTEKPHDKTSILRKEIALFVAMLFVGLVLMPIVIWIVGNAVFGDYGGAGYGDFFSILSGRIRSGDLVAWFLVLSPWFAVQIVRIAVFAWRKAGKL